MSAVQPTLDFGEPESRIQRDFERFHAANPDVYALLCKFAREAKGRGAKKWGIAAIFEVVRWHIKVNLNRDGEFKCNNNFRSRYARLIMAREPDLDGFFDTRELKERAH